MVAYDNIKFTKGTDIVYIGTIQVEENIINALKVISFPTEEDAPEETQILNLNRVEKRFTINGIINYGKLNKPEEPDETHTTARDKKMLLRTMFDRGSTVTMTFEDADYDISVEKFNIKYKSYDGADSVDGEAVYNVIITCVVGEDIL